MPSRALGTRKVVVNKTNEVSDLMDFTFYWREMVSKRKHGTSY